MLLGSHHVTAADFESEGLYFNIVPPYDSRQAEVTFNPDRHTVKEGSYKGQVTIPEQVAYQGEMYDVVGIGVEAFKYSQEITGIDWNAAITYIADRAFEGVENVFLTEITNRDENSVEYTLLPWSVSQVGERAFAESGLKSFYDNVRMSDGPERVSYGIGAFKDCAKLKTVRLNNNVANECFSGCTALESISCTKNVSYIGEKAFSGCRALTSEGLSIDVEDIGERAFENCTGLKWINSDENLRTIGAYAFAGCTGLASCSFAGTSLYVNGDY